MTDVYQAPKSELSSTEFSSNNGSIENGISGNYSLEIGDVLSEAWARTKGAKLSINLAFTVYAGIILIGSFISMGVILVPVIASSGNPLTVIPSLMLANIAMIVVIIPMVGGLFMMGVKRAAGLPIAVENIFAYYSKIVPLVLLLIVSNIFIQIGYFLLVIPGIYLTVAYVMGMPLILEKNFSFWNAMETSRKAVTRKWFQMFGLLIVLLIINMIATIPLGIGLFWTMPMSLIAIGIVYRNMFGVSSVQEN